MGRLTRDQIISAGLAKAGNNSAIATDAVTVFQAVLDELYAAHPWVVRRYAFTTAAAQATFAFGNGSSSPASVTERVKSIRSIKFAETSNTGHKGDLRIVQPHEVDPTEERSWNDSTPGGRPTKMLVEASTSNPFQWNLTLIPSPDVAYRFLAEAHVIPAALGASDIPFYPNDRTLIEVVVQWATFYNVDERFILEESLVAKMAVADRVNFGNVSGRPGVVPLSPHRFPRRR